MSLTYELVLLRTIKLVRAKLRLHAENPGIQPVATQIYTHIHTQRTKAPFLRELDRLLLEPKSRIADEVDFKYKTEKAKH